MKRWCKSCQGAYPEREGGIQHAADGASLHWLCYACTRKAKISGGGRVRSLTDILDEEGSAGVDAALNALKRTA